MLSNKLTRRIELTEPNCGGDACKCMLDLAVALFLAFTYWINEDACDSPTYSTSFGALPGFVSDDGDVLLCDKRTVAIALRMKCTAMRA